MRIKDFSTPLSVSLLIGAVLVSGFVLGFGGLVEVQATGEGVKVIIDGRR